MDAIEFVTRDALEDLRGRELPGRFAGLWVRGSCDALGAPVAVLVGARAASTAGRRLAHRLARELARAGICIVSGLALGIDGAAHEGALDAGGPTIGVLGGGHGHFFPPSHRGLADRIVATGGGVVSPFPPTRVPRPFMFLERNAVIAALGDVVVVVEAAARSGALNTANWAAAYGLPVLAVPGDVDRPKVAGCLALIRDGAILARDAADVLEALPAHVVPRLRPASAASLHPAPGGPLGVVPGAALERRLVDLLARADGAISIDRLVAETGEPPGPVLAALTVLEIAGRIRRCDGERFAPAR